MRLGKLARRAGHALWVSLQESGAMRMGDTEAWQAIHADEHAHGHLLNVTTLHTPDRPHEMTPAECDPPRVTLRDVPWGERPA